MTNIIKRIVTWKVFAFVLITLYIFSKLLISPAEYSGITMNNYQTFCGIFQSFIDAFVFSIVFALGFKKILFSTKQLCFILLFILVIYAVDTFLFVLTGNNLSLKDVFLQLLYLSPLVLLFYFYLRNINKYTYIDKPILKILSVYFSVNMCVSVTKIVFWEYITHTIYTIPDYINMVTNILCIPFLLAYAWNFKYKTNTAIKSCVVNIIGISILSSCFCSREFFNNIGIFSMLSNAVGIIYIVLSNIFIYYLIYKSAFVKK